MSGRISCPVPQGFLAYDGITGFPVTPFRRIIPLVASAADGGVAGWRNDFPFTVEAQQARLVVRTASTGASTVNVGRAASLAAAPTTVYGSAANTGVAGVKNVITGTTVPSTYRLAPGECITVSQATGDTTGVAGWLWVEVTPLGSVRN